MDRRINLNYMKAKNIIGLILLISILIVPMVLMVGINQQSLLIIGVIVVLFGLLRLAFWLILCED